MGAGGFGSATMLPNLILSIMAIFSGAYNCCRASVGRQQNTVCSINKKAILKMLF
jgi:hypothetical protein